MTAPGARSPIRRTPDLGWPTARRCWLLEARNKLEGNARLNWSDVTPIASWEGITLRGTPERVAWVDLRAKGLSGTVPAELGQLSMLTYLNLRSNDLSGEIPDELGRLTNLQKLLLHDNGLSGGFPNLRGLRNLTHLWLSGANHSVGAGGGVPTWLNGLTNLVELNLWGNEMGRDDSRPERPDKPEAAEAPEQRA